MPCLRFSPIYCREQRGDFMYRDKSLLLLFLLVPAMLLVPFVHADDTPGLHVRIVHVSTVSGQVQISHQQSSGYQNVTMNMPVVQGDIIRTGDDGWVEIQLENGSRIRLAPDSEMTFSLLSRFASGATASEVSLDNGEASFAVVAGDDIGPFRLNVHQRVISLKRSSRFRVTSIPSDPLEVVVWRGEVGIFDRDQSQEVSVQALETFVLNPQDVGQYDLEKEAKVDELDDWANQRDQALIAYADTQSSLPPTVPPLYYGQQYQSLTSPPLYNNLGYGYDPFVFGYWGSPFAFGGFSPFFWQPGFFGPVILVPPVIVRPTPHGIRPPVPPAVRAAATNPALTVSTDRANRLVISNEHAAQADVFDPLGPKSTAVASTGQRPVRTHPPVEMPLVAPRQSAVNTGAHGSPTAASPRPQASRAPSVSSPPRSFSPPASAPAVHMGGGRH